MAALRGIDYQARLAPRKVDELLSEPVAQTKHWITAENAPMKTEVPELWKLHLY
jgi:hypothetical protein